MKGIYTGKAVFAGIAVGRISVFHKEDQSIKRVHVENTAAETARAEAARDEANAQLAGLYEKAVQEVGESGAAVFEVHQMMLQDEDYMDSVRNIIETQEVNAEYAVASTGDNFAAMFAAMEDDYMQARAADVKDISERLVRILSGARDALPESEGPVILVAEDLAPSETVQLDKSRLLAFVTRYGSSNSHTAILARTMNLPALIGVDYEPEIDGKMGIVDGKQGILLVDPDEETLKKYEKQRDQELDKRAMLKELKGKETITKSGRTVKLYANSR